MTDRLLRDLDGEALTRADDLLDRANHDVGKYMSITARNLDPSRAGRAELDLLLRDLTRTDGSRAAWVVWGELSGALGALAHDPDLDDIDTAMTALAHMVTADHGALDVQALVRVTLDVADRIARLRRAVRKRRMEVDR